MISENFKTIFVHIPKTAGTSIEAFLRDENQPTGSDHAPLSDYAKLVDLNKYFTFSIVRHPLTRAHSLFRYYKSGGNQQHYKYGIVNPIYDFVKSGGQHFVRHSDTDISKKMPNTFADFCKKYLRDQKPFFGRNVLQPQVDFLAINNEINLDFIGKFENLEQDFEVIANQIGKTGTLPHFRKSITANAEVVFDETSKEIVFDFYRKDFERLGY